MTIASQQALSANDWHVRARNISPATGPFIDGKYNKSGSDALFPSTNPATGQILATLPSCNAADVDKACQAARRSFDAGEWRRRGPLAKKAVMFAIADMMEREVENFALLDCLEVGKTISDAQKEVYIAAGFFRFYGEALDKVNGSVIPSDDTVLGINIREPVGVVGAIVPWNFPLINASLKVAPALAAGNSLVLKPSEISSLSALKLGDIVQQAGLPDGVLNIVPGLGSDVGEAICKHPLIDMITFTGSTLTGSRIMELAAQNGTKRVHLECGGKSPQVIFNDGIDLAAAIPSIAYDAYWNQGQVCISRCKLIVEEGLKDDLVAALKTELKNYQPGDPLDPATRFGSVAGDRFFDRIMGYINLADSEGAKILCGGKPSRQESGGFYIEPTIIENVRAGSRLAREEIFGPVLALQTFRTEEEAIALANDTDFGLAATVWTRDMARGMRMAHSVRAGKVKIQSAPPRGEGTGFALGAEPVKASGFGSEFGLEGLKAYSTLKAIEFLV